MVTLTDRQQIELLVAFLSNPATSMIHVSFAVTKPS